MVRERVELPFSSCANLDKLFTSLKWGVIIIIHRIHVRIE